MNVREAWKQAVATLRAADVPSPALAAELLLMHVVGANRAWLYAHTDDALEPDSARRYEALVARRAAGTPTQYLTGRQEFWGLELEVTPDVLIPRPETEHVVETALARLGQARSLDPLRVADVGTGSGCLALALARELPRATIFATDLSARALAVAQRNAARHGFSDRIAFLEASLLAPLGPGSLDLVVSNPPYVGRGEAACLPREVREHEPAEALLAGEEGIEIYPPLIAEAAARLVEGGLLVVELGYGAGERVKALLRPEAWRGIEVTSDLAGIPRVVAAARA